MEAEQVENFSAWSWLYLIGEVFFIYAYFTGDNFVN